MLAVFSFLHGYFNSEPKISIGALFVLVLFLPFAVLAWATSFHFIFWRDVLFGLSSIEDRIL